MSDKSIPPPEPFLWTPSIEIEPCFRIPFRLLLSQNDLTGEKWEKTQRIELWRQRGEARFIEACREKGLEVEDYHEVKRYQYRGKPKQKILAGTRLKEILFNEPILILARLWLSDNTAFDIDNLHLKAVIDGFVDGGLIPDDNVKFLRGIFRWYEGIDPSAALSAEEKEARSETRRQWKEAGIKREMPPPPNKRIWLDIYTINRIIEDRININSLLGFPPLTI